MTKTETDNLVEIDGSFGEGGGQIIRTSVALSMVTGKPFEITNIRANRKKPGLQNQHLTAIKAAQQLCGADVSGLEIGASSIRFVPGKTHPGNYFFDIGTAGSTTLVFQTILYALMVLDKPSNVRIKGGTHNPFAPTFEFISKTFLPTVKMFGPKIDAKLIRHGFYPKGGGELSFDIKPIEMGSLSRVDLTDALELEETSASVILANLPAHIAKRELKVVSDQIKFLKKTSIVEAKGSYSPGNVVNIFSKSKTITETFSQLGKRGVKAEDVAQRAVDEFLAYRACSAPVGEYLADQLLLPMALAGGGKILTLKPSDHTITNIDTIKKFLDISVEIKEVGEKQFLIELN